MGYTIPIAAVRAGARSDVSFVCGRARLAEEFPIRRILEELGGSVSASPGEIASA